jgi:HEPN domain-containing protein
MTEETLHEWTGKAEEDYHLALAAMRQKKYPAYGGVCFHAQQSAEKYLKAFLVRHQIRFGKTHELGELCQSCIDVDGTFNLIVDPVLLLNPYAVDVRYPGIHATEDDAREAVAAMKEVRRFVRKRLGLK